MGDLRFVVALFLLGAAVSVSATSVAAMGRNGGSPVPSSTSCHRHEEDHFATSKENKSNNVCSGKSRTEEASRRPTCPPPALVPLSDFDLEAYVAAPWYVQRQIPLDYQPVQDLYCVKAEYEIVDRKNLSAGIIVNNYANTGRVNGSPKGSSKYDRTGSPRLMAFPAGSEVGAARDGRLLVGPELLLTMLPGDAWRSAFGPYWVVAVGPSKDRKIGYDWAIISGGAPNHDSRNHKGCSSVSYTQNDDKGGSVSVHSSSKNARDFDRGGLWFFSRRPVDPEATAEMEEKAEELGLDTSQMLPVHQAGCKYDS
ncbi:hypothetical protein Vafri_11501 [Volvox africanus]|nr:hypothetical protein Vafri_11501 [Volvox africanus]